MPLAHSRGSGWFPVAVQALVFLSETDGASTTCRPSSAMAHDLQSHAVFLRRVLAQLGRANLIQAREGRDGGYRLARPAEQITLAEVYQAVNALDPTDHTAGASDVPTPVQSALDEIEAEAERQRLEVLGRFTLASVLQRVTSSGRRS
jgi:Rrf2 family transcriptional regulator, repressor of oqxAB